MPDIYAALSNPVRAKLVLCLARKPKNVTEMIRTCGLSQSAVSQHLAKLRACGIVETKREGTAVWYRLKYPRAAEISRLLVSLDHDVT